MSKVHTPTGVYPSIASAARAMRVDRSTLAKRLESDPKHYWRDGDSPFASYNSGRSEGLPAWYEYRYMSWDVKEAIYQAWCDQRGLNPDLDATANEFFDDMDSVTAVTVEQQDEDPAET